MISKSPNRNTFQKEKYLEHCKEKEQEPSQDYLDLFDSLLNQDKNKFMDPKSRENNLEYDLLTTDWILEKARVSRSYAQNIYSALCNNEFQKLDVIPILTENTWGCSWRYAGGIVADMRQQGDYIDWYCSGIRDREQPSEEEWNNWTTEQQNEYTVNFSKYLPEGCISQEIIQDLKKLGWVPAKGGDWENF